MNSITIYGNLTKDCTTTKAGENTLTRFTLADNYNDKGEKKTNFFNVTAFGKAGETIAKYVKKGDPLIVTGNMKTNAYTDKDGNKREYTEVILRDFAFAGTGAAKKDPEPPEDGNPFGDPTNA